MNNVKVIVGKIIGCVVFCAVVFLLFCTCAFKFESYFVSNPINEMVLIRQTAMEFCIMRWCLLFSLIFTVGCVWFKDFMGILKTLAIFVVVFIGYIFVWDGINDVLKHWELLRRYIYNIHTPFFQIDMAMFYMVLGILAAWGIWFCRRFDVVKQKV